MRCKNNICLPSLWIVAKKTNHRAASSQNISPKMLASSDYEPSSFDGSPHLSALKLEELSLGVLNKLSPGNLKRATSDFMREWEKSLGEPEAIKDKAC